MLNRPKYRARKVVHDGIKFDSKRELTEWLRLSDMEKKGEITDLQRQVPFVLIETFKNGKGETVRGIKYIADFVYCKDGETIVADSKGMKLPLYITKKKLFEKRYYPLTITEV